MTLLGVSCQYMAENWELTENRQKCHIFIYSMYLKLLSEEVDYYCDYFA